jgi:hypothetical protein
MQARLPGQLHGHVETEFDPAVGGGDPSSAPSFCGRRSGVEDLRDHARASASLALARRRSTMGAAQIEVLEEDEQRDPLEDRRDRVDARKSHGDRDQHDHPRPPALPQPRGAEDAEPHEAKQEDRQLEEGSHPGDHEGRERVVVARPDLDLEELVVEAEQEGDRRGQHDPVGERHPPASNAEATSTSWNTFR